MANVRDLRGLVFGQLTAISVAGRNKHGLLTWLCRCECGREHVVVGTSLTRGHTTTCGKHNLHLKQKYPLVYGVWNTMKQRCSNPNVASYKDYGGRGIKVCKRWVDSFEAFFDDMGDRPSPQHSIERRDNDGDYSPSNCFWAIKEVQVKNRRNNRMLTANGETLHMAEWARRLGCNPAAIIARLNSGMDEAEAVTKPVPPRPNAKLANKDVQYIRSAYPDLSMEKIAATLGVSKKTVFNVIHGKIFVDV